jgi:hypothetical protein
LILQFCTPMNKYISTYHLLLFVIMIFGSCSILEGPEDISNPFDPSDPNFEPPNVTFLQAPSEGETVDTCLVTLDWVGNESNMNYSYRMDDQDWSEWGSDHTIEYPLLDEGSHNFEIKSRYFNGVERVDPQIVSFEIDDLTGPALACFPRYSLVAQDESVGVEIIVYDVTDVAMIRVVLNYNPTLLTANSVHVYESESFLATNGGAVIPFYSIDPALGLITIEVAVATGNPTSVSGTGAIANIDFMPTSTQSGELSFELSSEFRDADNTTTQIKDFGNGGVYVE